MLTHVPPVRVASTTATEAPSSAARNAAAGAQASAVPALLSAAERGHRLQAGAALLFMWDATSNYASLGKTFLDVVEPEPSAEAKLQLVGATS